VAVLTMARDEGRMLSRWVDHYGHHVGHENLVVLDDNSEDGSTCGLPCTVHRHPPMPGHKRFEVRLMELVSGLAQGLLAVYDFVVFVDVDEFLVPDPKNYDRLVDFLATRRDSPVLAPVTLNVVHHVRVEGPLDRDQPVLGQRRFAKFVPLMCKPCVKQVPARWRYATHGIMAPFEVDPELFMIHLKFHDRDALRAVADQRRRMVDADGRGGGSSWRAGGEPLASRLESFVAGVDPDDVPEFDPSSLDLKALVHRTAGGAYRTVPQGQVRAMESQPLLRVPERLYGTL
jgi:hypothetical protein